MCVCFSHSKSPLGIRSSGCVGELRDRGRANVIARKAVRDARLYIGDPNGGVIRKAIARDKIGRKVDFYTAIFPKQRASETSQVEPDRVGSNRVGSGRVE